MVHFYVRDHVKSLSAFSFKLQLFELSLMVGAKGYLLNVLPTSKIHSCSSSHFCISSTRRNIILRGDSMEMDKKDMLGILPLNSCLPVPELVGLNSQVLLLSGSI